MKKKIISILLVLVVLCAMLPQLTAAANAQESNYEYYRKLYTDYLMTTGYKDVFNTSSSKNVQISSLLIDMNSDGIYELLLGLTNTAGFGPRGYETQYALFTAKGNQVIVLKDAYYGGGSMGGESVSIRYDSQEKCCAFLLGSTLINGIQNVTGTAECYRLVNGTLVNYLTLFEMNCSKTQYQSEYNKVKRETSCYYEDAWNFQYYQINGAYVSKESYNSRFSEFSAYNDAKFQMRSCSYNAPIPPASMTPSSMFYDVMVGAWYHNAVNYAVSNGLMNGVSGGIFDPEGNMTRAMLVTVLWRYEGCPKDRSSSFQDVKSGEWYTDAISWASASSIVSGVGGGRFDPNGSITREQIAVILFRYAQKKGIDTSARGSLGSFPDQAKVSSWAKDAMSWAVGKGLIGGSDGKLLPQGNATRVQVATILMRFIQNIAEK